MPIERAPYLCPSIPRPWFQRFRPSHRSLPPGEKRRVVSCHVRLQVTEKIESSFRSYWLPVSSRVHLCAIFSRRTRKWGCSGWECFIRSDSYCVVFVVGQSVGLVSHKRSCKIMLRARQDCGTLLGTVSRRDCGAAQLPCAQTLTLSYKLKKKSLMLYNTPSYAGTW